MVTAVYYSRFKTFFRSKSIAHTYNIICNFPDSPEAIRMLSALNYSPDSRQAPLTRRHEFIHRVTYHIHKVTKQHEQKVLPSLQVLIGVCAQASATLPTSPFLHCFEQFGCHTVDGSVQTIWDNNEECMEEETYSSREEESDEESRSDTQRRTQPQNHQISHT